MAKQEEYKRPNDGERIKLQRFLTQLHLAAVFFKKNFVGENKPSTTLDSVW